MMHRRRSTLAACALVMACLAGATVGPALAPRLAAADTPGASTTMPPNSITTNGSGDVNIVPDMATVTFGVLINRDTAQDAQAGVNVAIAAAVKNLRALGIPDRQIQTADISLNPRYDNSGNVAGYQASQTLSIVVYGLKLVGRVIDAGVAAKANNNVSITFGLRNESAARASALKLAIQDARVRAAAAAAALGRSLAGAHVQLSESGTPMPHPVFDSAQKGLATGNAAPSTPTFSGTLTVHEDVTLTYTF